MRELFIYWRTPASTVAHAIHAAGEWQRQLRRQMPGLHAALYRRADDDAGVTATLMEVYAAFDEATFERRIVDEGAQVLAPWLAGPRHVETFERCGGE